MAADSAEIEISGIRNRATVDEDAYHKLSADSRLTDKVSNQIIRDMMRNQTTTTDESSAVFISDDKPVKPREYNPIPLSWDRDRVVRIAASSVYIEMEQETPGKLSEDGRGRFYIAQAMAHQYFNTGDAEKTDRLAKEISAFLHKGMTLKITDDPALTKQEVDKSIKENRPKPEYVRRVEVFDKSGKSLVSFDVVVAITERAKALRN